MKKNERKALKASLLTAIIKKLKENNAELSNKFEKAIQKSIKQIVKKAKKKNNELVQKKKKPAIVLSKRSRKKEKQK